jgi:hypothetical protein
MSWDVGYMGTCANCGLHVHAAYEDHANVTPEWTYCPACERVDVIARVNAVDDFWTTSPSCGSCNGPLEKWDETTCPRCHTKNRWDPILAAN